MHILGRRRRPTRVFYGWWMALAGMAMLLYADGVGLYGFGAFFAAMINEFRWSQAAAATALSLRQVGSVALAPLIGWMVDSLGPRAVLVMGFGVAGACLMLMSRIQHLWQFQALAGVLAFGTMAGSFLVSSAAVSNWFLRMRGRALSIVILGAGLAGVLASVWVWVIAAVGWRLPLVLAGVGFWVVCIPLALVMRRRPEDYGQLPDGDEARASGPTEEGDSSGDSGRGEPLLPLGQVLRSRGYWQFVAASAFADIVFAFVTFAVLALGHFGLPPRAVGLFFLWLGLASLPARLGSGFLVDRFDVRLVFAGSLALQMAGALLFAFTTSAWMAFLAAAFLGMGIGSSTPSRLALQAEYWGRSVFGRLAGIQHAASAPSGIAAPLFIGWMFDTFSSYRPPFAVLGVLLAVAVPLALTIGRPTVAQRLDPEASAPSD